MSRRISRHVTSVVTEVLESRRLLSVEPQPFMLTATSAPETITTAETIGDFYSEPATYTKFYMVEGEGSEGNMYFRTADRHLKPWLNLDYEVQNVFSIRVRAEDDLGNFVEQIFWLTITDVNEAPTSISLSNSSVAENLPPHTLVGDLSASDPEGDAVTFSLTANDPDNTNFEIVGNTLKTTAVFDYETKDSYTITVRATDPDGLYLDEQFTVSVLDGDDIPVAVTDYADTKGRSRINIINVLANDIDPEAGSLTVTLGDLPTMGTVVLNPDGSFRYNATLGYIGTDSFTYTVTDIMGQTATGTVNIDVTIPSIPHILVDGTLGADNMGVSVVDGVIRYQLEDFIRQFMFEGTLSFTMVAHSGDDLITVDDSMPMGVIVYASMGNDTIYGGPGADSLMGCNGNDLVYGGLGDDRVDGGGDNDTVIGGEGNDLVIGFEGLDSLEGNAGNDRMYGGPAVDILVGGDGDDKLMGGRGDDLIYGNAGNDLAWGERENDQISGGAGQDSIRGNYGSDTLHGDEDNDSLYGDLNDDELHGDAGADFLKGGPDNDRLYGGAEGDRLDGDMGDDLLEGGDDADILYGGYGLDRLFGQGGDDRLLGGQHADYLNGGDGVDKICGDDGDDEFDAIDGVADALFGGSGNDNASVDPADVLTRVETRVLA